MSNLMVMYKISQSTKKMQVWQCWSAYDKVITTYGELDGKSQMNSYEAKPMNIGKANETTGPEQAKAEVLALYRKQYDNKHYRYSKEEAEVAADTCKIPMKVNTYSKHLKKMEGVRTYSDIKLNGSRLMVINGQAYSKAGKPEEIKVDHLRNAIQELELNGYATFDAEVYCHGMSLQRIRAAFTKPVRTDKELAKMATNPREDALNLELHVFDIPVEGHDYENRMSMREELRQAVEEFDLDDVIKFTKRAGVTHTEMERLQLRDQVVAKGYEGLMHIQPDSMYEFGKKIYTTLKDKARLDSEALVLDCIMNKNGQGTLVLKTNADFGSVQFKGVMKGDAESRDYNEQCKFIGKWVTFQYEELSDKGVPTKPTVCETRLCDARGEPLE